MKACSKCKEIKPLTDYPKDRQKKDGFSSACKVCRAAATRDYYQRNKSKVLEKAKEREGAPEAKAKKATYDSNYLKENTKYIQARKSAWYQKDKEENPEKYLEIKKEQRERKRKHRRKIGIEPQRRISPEQRRQERKDYKASSAPYSLYGSKLPITDNPTEDEVTGDLLVKCRSCQKEIRPTRSQVSNRLSALNGNIQGEHNFYCSEGCKKSCILFNFSPERHYDPRIPREENLARGCQTEHLKILQCDELGHNYCERCQDIIDVELHHTLPVAEFKDKAIDSSGHILLCWKCHREVHKQC